MGNRVKLTKKGYEAVQFIRAQKQMYIDHETGELLKRPDFYDFTESGMQENIELAQRLKKEREKSI